MIQNKSKTSSDEDIDTLLEHDLEIFRKFKIHRSRRRASSSRSSLGSNPLENGRNNKKKMDAPLPPQTGVQQNSAGLIFSPRSPPQPTSKQSAPAAYAYEKFKHSRTRSSPFLLGEGMDLASIKDVPDKSERSRTPRHSPGVQFGYGFEHRVPARNPTPLNEEDAHRPRREISYRRPPPRKKDGEAGSDESLDHIVRSSYTVLSVDDDSINQKVMENLLRAEGYIVIKAYNGHEALKIIEDAFEAHRVRRPDDTEPTFVEGLPDVILLDVMMPGISGFKVAKMLRKKYVPQLLPIIMISEIATAASAQKGIRHGANEFLMKPMSRFAKVELLSRIRTQIKLKQVWQLEKQQEMDRKEAAEPATKLPPSLPEHVCERLGQGQTDIIDTYPRDHIMALIGVEGIDYQKHGPILYAQVLGQVFSLIDRIATDAGVSKIQIFGESYVASSVVRNLDAGATGSDVDDNEAPGAAAGRGRRSEGIDDEKARMAASGRRMLVFARRVIRGIARLSAEMNIDVEISVAMHSGQVASALLGMSLQPQYTLFGPAFQDLRAVYMHAAVPGCIVATGAAVRAAIEEGEGDEDDARRAGAPSGGSRSARKSNRSDSTHRHRHRHRHRHHSRSSSSSSSSSGSSRSRGRTGNNDAPRRVTGNVKNLLFLLSSAGQQGWCSHKTVALGSGERRRRGGRAIATVALACTRTAKRRQQLQLQEGHDGQNEDDGEEAEEKVERSFQIRKGNHVWGGRDTKRRGYTAATSPPTTSPRNPLGIGHGGGGSSDTNRNHTPLHRPNNHTSYISSSSSMGGGVHCRTPPAAAASGAEEIDELLERELRMMHKDAASLATRVTRDAMNRVARNIQRHRRIRSNPHLTLGAQQQYLQKAQWRRQRRKSPPMTVTPRSVSSTPRYTPAKANDGRPHS